MKKLNSKLKFKKETISTLDKKAMHTLKGMGTVHCNERSLYNTSCHAH